MNDMVRNIVGDSKKFFHIWWVLTAQSTQTALASKLGASLFISGKILRFVFFLLFLIIVLSKTNIVAGYTLWQMVLFYATFNLIDTMTQFFLREVYRFRGYVISGNFDYMLTKPLSPLLRSLFGGSDILDLIPLFSLLFFIGYITLHLSGVTLLSICIYALLVINAFLIALSFHIFVIALGVITTEVDNAIWMFREMTQLGRVPIEIYREPLSFVLTFVLPVAIMVTFPARALMGTLSFQWVLIAFFFSGLFLFLSYRFWQYALKQYASASS